MEGSTGEGNTELNHAEFGGPQRESDMNLKVPPIALLLIHLTLLALNIHNCHLDT